ncbi:hypothetical protein Henu6_gp145 [Acinetobacter phage Henu6]|uniref:Uncharacterized protein n=2 Tax=Caudoviricetes TaxID=2731619 RepID=A0A410T5N2_9CAUD|nr:hypothetical protein Henu6_gp145 [Acinetobacter phage Henu6]
MANQETCVHDFNYNSVLLSNPPQVRCRKCRTTMIVSDAQVYDAKRRAKEFDSINKPKREPPDLGPIWLTSVLSRLKDGSTPTQAFNTADKICEEYKIRFIEKS